MPHRRITLRKIPPPRPKSRPVFRPYSLPAFTGEDDTDMVCAECDAVIIQGIAPENWLLASSEGLPVVIRCVSCGSYLEVPVKHQEGREGS